MQERRTWGAAAPFGHQTRPKGETKRSYKEVLAPYGGREGHCTTDRLKPRALQGVCLADGGREVEMELRWQMDVLQNQLWKVQKEVEDLRKLVGRNKEIRVEESGAEKEGPGWYQTEKAHQKQKNMGPVWRKVGLKVVGPHHSGPSDARCNGRMDGLGPSVQKES